MSKKPPVPQSKKLPKSPVSAKPAAVAAPKSSINIKAIVLFAVLAISFILYLKNIYGAQNIAEGFTNTFIKRQASWILSIQPLIAFLIYAVVGYIGYLFVSKKEPGKWVNIAMGLGLLLIVALHWLAFNASFEVNVDDNASYMIAAKSLVQYGAPYYTYLPPDGAAMKVDTEGALGLPLMLIPIYWIWGMNFKPMEIMIFLSMIGSVAMCYLLFKRLTDRLFAIIIAIVFATHPYVVAFSSIIMTEIPYLFWSLMAIFLVMKFQSREKFSIWYLLAAVFAVFMTYLTRAVGIGLIMATVVYMLARSNMWPYLKKKSFGFIKDTKFLRFIIISAVLFIIVLLYQLWARSLGGVSQAETLAKMNIMDLFKKNYDAIWNVLAQNIFTGTLIRWKLANVVGQQPEAVGFLWIIITLVTLFGWIISLLKRELVAFTAFFVILVLMVGNTAVQPMVVSRYLIIFTPFFIYFLYKGIQWPIDKLSKTAEWGKVLGTVALIAILSSSFTGNAYNIAQSHTGSLYSPSEASFIECAEWAKSNIDKDAIVASRKERVFFVFSDGLRGYKHFSNADSKLLDEGMTMQEFEKYKLDQIAKYKTSYLVLDTFSSSSMQMILPIIQNNPTKFKLIKTFGDEKTGPCYLFQVLLNA